jgi:outer membrane protein OmpA-like peptidoglycan-associated protein
MSKTLSLQGGRLLTRRERLLGAAVLAAVLVSWLPVKAADAASGSRNGYGSSIVINTEVLNSLSSQGPAPNLPYQRRLHGDGVVVPSQGGYLGYSQTYGGGVLLFPPASSPSSQFVAGQQGGAQVGSALLYSSAPQATASPTPEAGSAVQNSGQATSQLLIQPTAAAADTATATTTPSVSVAIPSASETIETTAVPEVPKVAVAMPSSDDGSESVSSQAAALPALAVVTPEPAAVTPEPAVEAATPLPPEPEAPTVAALAPVPAAHEEISPAALPEPSSGSVASLGFQAGSAELTDETRGLLTDLAARMNSESGLRVQLLAYAGSNEDSPNAARRLSLSRALVVRGYLIDQGIASTRMQVRALGDNVEQGSPERVDIRSQGS